MQVDTPEAAPGTLGRDTCRIVREALTNAGKHARGAKVAVSIAGRPGQGLQVTVRNPLPDRPAREPPLPGTGTGLAGLAERVAVADGALSYGPDPAGDFVLNAALRWPAPEPSGTTRGRPLRVLLVDDDPLVRAGLRTILSSASDLDVVAEAADGAAAITAVRAHHVDVALMDVRMPGVDGITATKHITALPDPPKVLVLTTFHLDEYVFGALRAGASGFLLKDTPPADIVGAVRLVVAGDAMLSPSVTRTLIDHYSADPTQARRTAAEKTLKLLTEREREVAAAVGRGQSNADIAARLHMSEATVKAHVSRILTKLNAANRVQVAITMHDAGLA